MRRVLVPREGAVAVPKAKGAAGPHHQAQLLPAGVRTDLQADPPLHHRGLCRRAQGG